MKRKFSALLLLFSLFHTITGYAGMEEAKAAYNKKDYAIALQEVRPLAEQGNADAQNLLGTMYANGQGVPNDYTQTIRWYRKAAEQGNANAQFNLGYMYESGQVTHENKNQPLASLLETAEQILTGTRRNIGVIDGEERAQDRTQAFEWYRKAAEQGLAVAQLNVGIAYDEGLGIPQDYTQAIEWYRKAAEQGLVNAQLNLGYKYEKGQGTLQDYKQAIAWYRRAADQGDANAQFNLGVMYANGQGAPQSYGQAISWYRKAADQGYAKAQYGLGYIYANGQGIPKDNAQAAAWYRKATEQGHADAKHNLRLAEEELGKEQLAVSVKKQNEALKARGYKHMPFADFELDAKTIPLGTKIAITGLYQIDGKMEKLTESIIPNALSIILITDSASRSTRKRFLECRGVGSFCTMTLLGYTSKCDVTLFGRHVSTDICLVVEKNWELESKL
jgi:alpha/beta superfamily hydrolase